MSITELPVLKADELKAIDNKGQWLVRDIWAKGGIGVIGGPPKACKSFFALDMAVSVASGTPCLDRFTVQDKGAALVYFAEDGQPVVRSRLEAICRHRKLELSALDLYFITASSLRIDLEADREALIEAIEKFRPRLLLMDPLVRLHRLRENDAREMSGLLGFLRELQRRYELAVILVHHSSKRYRSQPGFGLRGSGDIYAVGDSNAYLAKRKEDKLTLTLEHRAAPSVEPLSLRLTDGPYLRILDEAEDDKKSDTIYAAIIRCLKGADTPLTRSAIRSQLKVNNQRLGDALQVLEDQKVVSRSKQGWHLEKGIQGQLNI